MLQYTDDTLIVVRGELEGVASLKRLTDLFADATGLCINYNKSPPCLFIWITIEHSNVFPCYVANCKNSPKFTSAYQSQHTSYRFQRSTSTLKTDRYLAGWQAVLLNSMGRAILVNSVLDSQLVYAMSALSILVTVLHKMDRRRRSFLWNGDNTAFPAQSLIAWERVCPSKDQGGLGIENLCLQNVCLLVKLLHRLHCSSELAWAEWLRKHAFSATLEGELFGEH